MQRFALGKLRAQLQMGRVGALQVLLPVGFALSVAVTACAREGASAATGSRGGSGGDVPEVLATIGDEKITLADIRQHAGSELDLIESQYLQARSRTIEGALQRLLRERVLEEEARRQNKSVQDLVLAEAGASANPGDVEVAAWFQENQSRMGGRSLDQVRAQIIDHLRSEAMRTAAERLEARLNRERGVVVSFQPYRLDFDNAGAPFLGNANAAVTVVEFSDFQCPYCRQFAPNLKQLEQEFGDKVHVVYRQFPLTNIHPHAFKAAEASLCAHEQGKFWQIHDMMFDEADRLGVSDLKDKARRVGLDQNRFNSCLDSGKYTEQVQRDLQEGQRAGVTGTPAVFINGKPLEGGAVPYSTVADAVRKELERRQSGS